jgi:hypothetical protein
MVDIKKNVSKYDLIRIGTYAQVEGNFRHHTHAGYRFTFFLHQIDDMKQLLQNVAYIPKFPNRTYVQFYSKSLFDALTELGFYKFGATDWNLPKVITQSDSYKYEYLRSLVDSLGTVDIDTVKNRNIPFVKIQSSNKNSMNKVHSLFGGKYYDWSDRSQIMWREKDAIDILNNLNGRFYSYHNQKGSDLIQSVRWDKFIW